MRRVSRRSALLLPLALLPGCSTLDDLLADEKKRFPGKREAVVAPRRGLAADPANVLAVEVPVPVGNAEWRQPGGVASHVMGNLAITGLTPSWRSGIGEGGGYRRKITAQPIVAGGRVFTMDSDGEVSAFDAAQGGRAWRVSTRGEKDRSTNIGGGITSAGDVVFASTGRAEALALDAGAGEVRWRSALDIPARSAPTAADGRLFVTLLDGKLLALDAATGERRWSYQGTAAPTALLGQPAPAVSDGLVVAGFGTGELIALRAEGGGLAWSDNLASSSGRNSLLDLSAVHGMPVIDEGVVFAIGMGGLMVAIDLRSGRRLWEREVGGTETPYVAGEWVFVQTTDQTLAALRKSDGRVGWITQLPRYDDPDRQRGPILWTGPVMGAGILVLAGSNGRLTAVLAETGKVLNTFPLSGAASVAPIAATGSVYVVTDDASVQAFR